uniref:Uncharacterized protein n=1 Tax=Arundo donax TaxID=35708 RepID=A0A0A8ZT26_ARUDO
MIYLSAAYGSICTSDFSLWKLKGLTSALDRTMMFLVYWACLCEVN